MNSLLIKRLPGILVVGLVALAVGAAGTTAVASNDAATRGLTPAQKRAKVKAIKKCKKIRKASRRRACIKRVVKRYTPKPPIGVTKTVGVVDDEFQPDDLTVKAGDSIDWIWSNDNANAHNVTLVQGPNSLTPTDKYNLSTPNSPSVQYSFKRKLTKTGEYDFICTLHSTVMDLKVKVTR